MRNDFGFLFQPKDQLECIELSRGLGVTKTLLVGLGVEPPIGQARGNP